MSLAELAMIAVDEHRIRDALALLRASLLINHDLGDLYQTALSLCRFARALAVEGRAETAAVLVSRSEALNEEIGVRVRSVGARMNAETITDIRAHLDEVAFLDAWERGRALTVDEAVALALDSVE